MALTRPALSLMARWMAIRRTPHRFGSAMTGGLPQRGLSVARPSIHRLPARRPRARRHATRLRTSTPCSRQSFGRSSAETCWPKTRAVNRSCDRDVTSRCERGGALRVFERRPAKRTGRTHMRELTAGFGTTLPHGTKKCTLSRRDWDSVSEASSQRPVEGMSRLRRRGAVSVWRRGAGETGQGIPRRPPAHRFAIPYERSARD